MFVLPGCGQSLLLDCALALSDLLSKASQHPQFEPLTAYLKHKSAYIIGRPASAFCNGKNALDEQKETKNQ